MRELEAYYKNRIELRDIILKKEYRKYEELGGREQNLDITLNSRELYRFEMRVAADDTCYSLITYDKKEQLLTFDRSCSGVRKDAAHLRSMKVLSNNQIVELRIVMDRYSIEIFVNDGEQAMTSVIRTPYDRNGIYMRADGNVTARIVKHDICVG